MSVLWSVLAGIGMVLLFLLKGVGILLVVVLVLGLLLMFCPFCADVQWAEGIFQVKAGALGITFPVFRYPAPEKPEKKKKDKKKKASGAQKPKKEAPPRQKAKLTLQIVCTILKGAGKLTRAIIGSLRFTRIDVVLGVRGEDPAEAARSYGRMNAWLYPTLDAHPVGTLGKIHLLAMQESGLRAAPAPAGFRQRRAHRKGSRLLPGHGPGLCHRLHASARSVRVLARKGTGRFSLARV